MMYQELLPRLQKRPSFELNSKPPLVMLAHVVREHLNISTMLAMGATLQAILITLPIPLRYTIFPGVSFLLFRILLTILGTTGLLRNTKLNGTIPGRFTAIVPDKYGNFPAEGEAPAKEKIAIFLLSARINHPGGWFASPHIAEFGNYFRKMNDELYQKSQSETGFLGHSQAFMPGANGTVGLLNYSYWRSKEHILEYADSPAHRDAVKWWSEMGAYDGKGGKVPHIAISHEIYESNPGQWENISMGCEPSGLAATAYLKGGEVSEKSMTHGEWMSPVVDASRGRLAGSRGRMGLPITRKQDEGIQM